MAGTVVLEKLWNLAESHGWSSPTIPQIMVLKSKALTVDPSPGSRGSEPESIPAMALLASGFAGKSLFCIWACLGATGAQTRRNPTKWNTKCSCRPHIHTNPCFILSSNFRGKGRSISSSWYCFTCRNGKESPSNPVHVGNWTSSRSTCCSCCAWCCCLAPERLFSHQIHSASNRRGVLHQLELAVEKLLLILEFLAAVAAMRDDVSVLGHLGRQLCGAESCCKAIWSCFRLWMITSLPQEYELDALVNLYPSWNIGPRRVRSSFMLSMLSSLEDHGEWVWVYIYEPMSMSSGSLSMWVCNAPLHRGQKGKIEKIALRYVCAGTGLKQAQRQRHDIHEYSLYDRSVSTTFLCLRSLLQRCQEQGTPREFPEGSSCRLDIPN